MRYRRSPGRGGIAERATRGLYATLAAVLVAVMAPVASMVPARAASSINVTTTADDLTTNGNCTLREALLAADTGHAVDKCVGTSAADTIRNSSAARSGWAINNSGSATLDHVLIDHDLGPNGASRRRRVAITRAGTAEDLVLQRWRG